jgi:tricorn protease
MRTTAPSRLLIGLAAAAAVLVPSGAVLAVDPADTRLLAEPAVSDEHVVFVYDEDLWIVERAGGTARRLTSHVGTEAHPRFSPDGALVAFSGEYDGNTDVYVVPATGGAPTRLTWHPGDDEVQGFSADGRRVLFASGRAAPLRGDDQLYEVPVAGGFPQRLPLPRAFEGSWSSDGRRLAYLPLPERFRQWKNYRGGTATKIWIYDPETHGVEQVPRPEGRSNDTDPMWVDGQLYFLSDRAGELNVFAYDPAAGEVRQVTHHEDFPVLAATAGGGRIVYEQAGWLHLLDPASGESERLVIGVPADLVETRSRFVGGAEHVRSADLSPSGTRAVFGYRGEIVTVPAEHGDPRNLTRSAGAHDRFPAWSPDGSRIAWFSDETGEYALHVARQDGSGAARVYEIDGAGFYEDPRWSPDGKKISFTDNSWTLHWIDLDSGRTHEVASHRLYGPIKSLHHAWSPDSRWLAFTRNTGTNLQTVNLHSLETGTSHLVTDGLSDVSEPVFDASGRYLWFFASTDAGPLRQWFAMSNADAQMTGGLYLAVLDAEAPSPLAPRSDEEPAGAEEGDEPDTGGDDVPQVVVDVDGIDQRIVPVPLPLGSYRGLRSANPRELHYLKGEAGLGLREFFGGPPPQSLCRYDLAEREEECLLEGARAFAVSADGKKALVQTAQGWSIVGARGKADPGKGKLDLDAVQVRIDPRAEWRQIFEEAWRINRDYFYDPGMHGADWQAERERYVQFLPHLATRGDLNRVLRWMSSELAVGHHRVGGGETRREAERVPGGLLGADYELDGDRYRFARIYGGLNWNPDLRAPLTEPGVDVQEGDYLLAVEGRELRAPESVHAPFENTAGRSVEITVGPHADGRDSRTLTVVPISDEGQLRHRAFVESNLERVTEATDGRVAYVYVPNTSLAGHESFKRYFYPQADRDALILDERHNGGGQVADYYIDIMRRPPLAWWATRYGEDFPSPLAAIHGPKVMLIDELAGSGGDLLPWMFRQLDLGTLVGKRTWGGLVGVLGFPGLMDGGYISAPNLAIWTEDGWIVENVGVPPDVEVDWRPADYVAGRDPQLERAIEIALEQLERTPPPQKPERPDYPVRVRR